MSFYVYASNIHTGESQQYGPFPGEPGLTYELLRCFVPFGDTNQDHWMDGEHIFQYSEMHETTFTHDDGDEVSYGWRRQMVKATGQGYYSSICVDQIWTDLSIRMTEDEPIRSNIYEDVTRDDTPRNTWGAQ
jgi:hypothetical protein